MTLNRKLKFLIIMILPFVLFFGAGVVLKNIFLFQVKKRIQSSLNYTHLHLTFIPASLVIEDLRSISTSPFYSAQKIVIQISYLSLLARDKPLDILIEQPVLRMYSDLPGLNQKKKPKSLWPFPFDVKKGLIRGGEFYFWGKRDSFYSKGINAFFKKEKENFSFRAESEENIFLLSSVGSQLSGAIAFSLEGNEKTITLKKMRIASPEFIVKAKGVLTDFDDPEFELKTSLHANAKFIVDLFDLPFDWEGKAGGEGELLRKQGKITFKALLSSNDLVLNKIPLGKVQGRLRVGEEGGKVEFGLQKRPYPREYVDISFSPSKVEGIARGFHLDPILNYFSLPWPVKSPAWGGFTFLNGRLEANAEFQDEFLINQPAKYAFRGQVKFDWDGKKGISFSSQKLESSFAKVDVEGQVEIGKEVNVTIKGEATDVGQAREFVSLVLKENFDFPEIRGKGFSEIKILGGYDSPQVKANFSFMPGGFAKFEASSVSGMAEINKGEFIGIFKVNDPKMTGNIELLSNPSGFEATIRLDKGNAEKILPALDIPLPLRGQASGNFEIRGRENELEVKGDFEGPSLSLARQELGEVKGRLEWGKAILSFPEIQMDVYQGRVKGNALLDFTNQGFDLDLSAENINLNSIVPSLEGTGSFYLKGKGSFHRDSASGKFDVQDLHYAPFETVQANGEVELSFAEQKINVKLRGVLEPGQNDFSFSFSYPFQKKPYMANLKGSLNNLDLLLPWKGAKGAINYLAEINGSNGSPQISGIIDFKGSLLPFPKFAHALNDYAGLIFIQNNKASLRSFQAKLGGGDIYGRGEVWLGKDGLEFVDLSAEGKDLLLSPLERTRALADGALRLVKDETRFVLEGNFFIKKLSWRREVSEKLIFSQAPFLEATQKPGFFDAMNLNISLKANDDAFIENSLGKIRSKFDLTVAGSVSSPLVLGEIEGLSGDVYFQDRKFKVLRAKLSFFNLSLVEPYLEFKGETYIKDYRVTFSLTGLLDHLRPEYSSSPPLPPEDVLALLALGESFKRTYSYDTSSQLSTGSFLSFQIAEEAKKRAEKLFNLDRFRIDPFVLGASTEMTARLTVGKKISRNLFLLYSTNISTQREEIVRLEWEFSDNFSLVGMRDERGRFSFDAKIRKRF